MRFKDDSLQAELAQTTTRTQVIAEAFCQESIARFGIDPIVTRVLEHICGDSGVHEARRGVDFRDEFPAGVFTFTDAQADELCAVINARFPRDDDKATAIFHSFQNGPRHCHIQARENPLPEVPVP